MGSRLYLGNRGDELGRGGSCVMVELDVKLLGFETGGGCEDGAGRNRLLPLIAANGLFIT